MNQAHAKSSTKNILTEPFNVYTGVRQGCLLSPFLFMLAVNWVMKSTTETHQRGIQWTFQKHLEDLDFADDIASFHTEA